MFKILNPNDASDTSYLAQMHNLRYNIFYKNLKWRSGLKSHSQMEFDDFDHENCRYLVRINPKDKVDACTRLTPTCFPYLLGDVFQDWIGKDHTAPRSANVIETSRLCSDSGSAPRNIVGLLMAAMLELGIKSGAERYVSLSDARVKPAVTKYGWKWDQLGEEKNTLTELSVALSYDVTKDYLDNVRKMVGVDSDLLDDSAPVLYFPSASYRPQGNTDQPQQTLH